MFRTLRKKHQSMDEEQIEEILKITEYGTVNTVGEDGYPYAVPVNYAYVDGAIYFHCAKTGHKLDNIDFNNKVSFTLVPFHKVLSEKFDSEYESVVVFGRASVVDTDEEKVKGLLGLIYKYSPEYEEAGRAYINRSKDAIKIVRIDIDHKAGKFYKD